MLLNDLQCGEKEITNLSKDSEELTPTKHNYYCKSSIGELTSNESESTMQNKENDVLFNNYGDLILIGTIFGTQIQSKPENMEVADKQLEGGEFENVKTNENSRLKGKTDAVGMDVEPV